MDLDFWLQRWERNEIGFHQEAVNSHLQRWWPALGLKVRARIFVPLCGKSRDMLWLHERGHEVIGVEVSRTAIDAFFTELGVEPRRTRRGAFEVCETPGIVLLAGDVFATQPADIADVRAVYDRAALIALPPEMRRRYAAHMTALLPSGVRTLLIAFEYTQQEMNGPPFSVPEDEVRELYGANHDIHVLAVEDVLDREPKFRERGLSRLHERVYLIVRNDTG